MKENIGSKIWKVFERFVLFCLRLILKPVKKELTPEQEQAFMQFVKFALVGVTNTLMSTFINWGTLLLLDQLGGFEGIDKYIGNTVAFILSVLWSYMLNSKFVFKESEDGEKRVWWKTLLKTYAAYAFTGLGLSNIISWICVDVWGISKYIAPLINLVISVPINYVMNKFWAYRQKDKDPKAKIEDTAETENV
jgi:putative flippase GtrA